MLLLVLCVIEIITFIIASVCVAWPALNGLRVDGGTHALTAIAIGQAAAALAVVVSIAVVVGRDIYQTFRRGLRRAQ